PAAPRYDDAPVLLPWRLFKARFPSPSAAPAFVIATGFMLVMGALAGYLLYASGFLYHAVRLVTMIPGGVGDLFLPFVYLAPWLVVILLGTLPWQIVRSARQNRVLQVEQD